MAIAPEVTQLAGHENTDDQLTRLESPKKGCFGGVRGSNSGNSRDERIPGIPRPGKDLLVCLGPLRHEPTAQHYLAAERSQRLPSVYGFETGLDRHPEAPDWPAG